MSLSGQFCGVCGTHFDQASYGQHSMVVQPSSQVHGRTIVKFLFWASLVPVGWFFFNFDFTDSLAGLRLPYVWAFPLSGIVLVVVGSVEAIITIWDDFVAMIPSKLFYWRQAFRDRWKFVGARNRFVIVSSVGEISIIG